MLSFWLVIFLSLLMVISLVFPWQKFFFLSGMTVLGPQNSFLIRYVELKKQRKKEQLAEKLPQDNCGNNSKPRTKHSEDAKKSLLLYRNGQQMKPGTVHHVIVASSPLRHSRFYDWPPDPRKATVVQAR